VRRARSSVVFVVGLLAVTALGAIMETAVLFSGWALSRHAEWVGSVLGLAFAIALVWLALGGAGQLRSSMGVPSSIRVHRDPFKHPDDP
jgi:hypothetical protein